MPKTHVVLVGACAIDTILTCPFFPEEDSKLRASTLVKRRGVNCPNTLEVLHQLAVTDESPLHQDETLQLSLIATLPAATSPSISFISDSFRLRGSKHAIDLSHCIYRDNHSEPVSSYIISAQATGSRTIVNHNVLTEMTFDEFCSRADSIFQTSGNTENIWFHFEGRIPEVTLHCIQFVQEQQKNLKERHGFSRVTISVELEKPGREGLQELAAEANVVFYSKSWAIGKGYVSAENCLESQARILLKSLDTIPLLICTWGDKGASLLQKIPDEADLRVQSLARVCPNDQIVDTVGAGDTFIAGMLFGLICRESMWSLQVKIDFANALAGTKILQSGFQGLAEQVKDRF